VADEAPSLFSFLKGQIRRKPVTAEDGTPGKGRGLRLAPGLWVAIVLSVVVVIVVLTSGDGGTPATNAAKSQSPSAGSASSDTPESPQPAPPQADRAPDSPGGPDASTAPGASHSPTGKTAYTRHRTALIVRSAPDNDSEVVARLGYDNQVTLMCHTTGPSTYGFQGKASTVWDKITTPGGNVGYVPDSWILTEAEVAQLVDPC
jgi:hypothetical protein